MGFLLAAERLRPTMGCKGQAASAIFRSSVFQIFFLCLSKLVAAYSLAPEPGRYLF